MKKILYLFVFLVLVFPVKAQFIEEFESYDFDTSTVYYTMKDPQTSVVLATGTFVDKKRSGLWYQYYPSGKIQFVQRYENGVRTGTWKSWDNNGRLVSRLVYKRGKLVASSISKYY
jgi:antitoxin component YwqK of YwqJK toxin-antitoxin module